MGKLSSFIYVGCRILYLEAHRKSELAINYASKVRKYSPETWVFWLCATTAEVFREDLSAIADVLPERQPIKDTCSQMGLVLDWLCKPRGQRWLMVVDDVNSIAFGV